MEKDPWYYRAEAILKVIVDSPFTVKDILDYFEDHIPTDEQNILLRGFVTEDGDQTQIMIQLRCDPGDGSGFCLGCPFRPT